MMKLRSQPWTSDPCVSLIAVGSLRTATEAEDCARGTAKSQTENEDKNSPQLFAEDISYILPWCFLLAFQEKKIF